MAPDATRREHPARTAVVVLNFNGESHLDACLGSLGRLDDFVPGTPGVPRDLAHRDVVWLFDNASADRSVELVETRYPWVRVIRSEENVGFPAAYNRAAATARSETLLLLNDDTRVEPGLLRSLHRARADHPGAFALACRITSWDGSRIDFAGADTFFTGHAWQRGIGEPTAGRPFREERVLFGCGGALLVDRGAFLEIGGFDPDYFSFFEDVDLGWRAAILGRDTWFVPDAVVRHQHHGSWGLQPQVRVRYLAERNALFTAYKNLHEERMGVVVLVASALTFLRAWHSSDGIRLHGRPFLTSDSVAYLLALADLARFEAGLAQRRGAVQARRARSDEEVLPLFGAYGSPPDALDDGYRRSVRALTGAAGIADDRAGGPFPAEINAAAEGAAMLLASVCADAVATRYPAEPFVTAGWDRDWEHALSPEADRALRDAEGAIARLVAAGISAASVAAFAGELAAARPRRPAPAATAPAPSPRAPRADPGGPITVSVVVRTKDRPDGLRRALASLAAQERLPDEVVVVNDGGEDPADVLHGFDGRLRIVTVTHDVGRGRSAAAQAGLEAASGTHVGYLDDDDELRPGHLRTLADAIVNEGARVAYADVECVAPGAPAPEAGEPPNVLGGPFDPSRLLFENTIPIMAVLMERGLALEVGGFDPDLEYFEDWDLFLRLARRTAFVHCPAVTATYHVAPQELGGGLAGNHRWPHLARLFDKHRAHITGNDWARFYRRQVEETRIRTGELYHENLMGASVTAQLALRLRAIESSLGWRLYQRARRLLGRR